MIVNQLRTMGDRRGVMERVSAGFPLSVYQTDFAALPYTPVSWHWHEDFQLCWVNRGAVRFQVVGQEYVLKEGAGLFINCRLAHMAEPASQDGSYYGMNFHPDLICPRRDSELYRRMVLPLIRPGAASAFVFRRDSAQGAALDRAFRQIRTLSERELPERELLIQSELLRAWPGILQMGGSSGEAVSASGNRRLKELLVYVSEHYGEKITLAHLAGRVHISEGECSRFFKKITGMTPFQYILWYRIERSKELLRQGEGTIAEIAQETGFASQSYYALCFHRQEGCTPGEYRRLTRPGAGGWRKGSSLRAGKQIE